MDLNARDIQEKQFHDAWRGYRQEEVDDFLDQVSEAIDAYQRENTALAERAHELEQAVSTARDTEEMLKKTLVTAQRAAEEAIASAKAKAKRIVEQGEEQAARLEKETTERLAGADAEIKRKTLEADRQQVRRKRELEASIERLTSHESEVKARLKAFFEQQARALDKLGDRPAVARRQAVKPPEESAEARAGGTAEAEADKRDTTITLPEAKPVEAKARPDSSPEAHAPEGGTGRRSILGLFRGEEGRPSESPRGSHLAPPSQGARTGEAASAVPADSPRSGQPKGPAGAQGGEDEDSVRIVTPSPAAGSKTPPAQRQPGGTSSGARRE